MRVGASVVLFAGFASWLGCSNGSSAGDQPANDDAGGVTLGPGNGAPADAGATDSASQIKDADRPDIDVTGPFYDLQYGNCPPVSACGGDLTGVWTLTGGCVDDTVFDTAKAQCPDLTSSDVKFTARGQVAAVGTGITRGTEAHFTANLQVPEICKLDNPLAAVPGYGTCADLDLAITLGAGLKSASCKDAKTGGGGCDCEVANDLSEYTSADYTTAGNVLTTGTGTAERTFDYCVANGGLTYKETTAGSAIPASFTLAQ
jgi:hypothetical protein